jgi:putative RecB family exonuclease
MRIIECIQQNVIKQIKGMFLSIYYMLYSHSRLSTFEQCPYKFKLKYIDKVETEIAENIEAYLGSRVHETLEKLYKDLQYQKMNTLEELLLFYKDIWEKNWSDSIVINKTEYGAENYFKMGEKYITDYYKRYHPFNQGSTIAIENRIVIDLDEKGTYKLQGFIDRLTEINDGYYEIHDYKTNSRLPLPEYIKNDRQLALYAIGVKECYPDAKDIRLIWHFLKFDKEIDSTRTNEELQLLKKETVQLIQTIEKTNVFETHASILCQWCEFQQICPQWSHLYKIHEKPDNEYLNDTGVQLVDRYTKLKKQTKQMKLDLYAELEKIEEALLAYAKKENIDVVFGSEKKIRIAIQPHYALPPKDSEKRKELHEYLKSVGKWHEVEKLNTNAINKVLIEKQWDETIIKTLREYVECNEKKRLYLSNYHS